MTFYSYGLNADQAGSVTYSQALSASSSETATTAMRQNPVHILLTAASLQAIGVGNHLTIGIGKVLSAVNAQIISLTRLKFGLRFVAANVLASQAAALSKRYLSSIALGASSSAVAFLYFPRLAHAVVAASQANSARLTRLSGHAISRIQPAVVSLTKSVGRLNAATSLLPQIVSIARSAGIIRGAAWTNAAQSVKTVSKIASAFLQPIASTPSRVIGHLITLTSGSVIQTLRAFPIRLIAVSSQAPRLIFGPGVYVRSFGAVESQAQAVSRGIFASRSLQTVGQAGLIKSPARPLGAAASSVAALSRATARLAGLAGPNVASAVRMIGLIRRLAAASVVATQTAGLHLPAALSAIQTQAASTQRSLVHTLQVAVQGFQASAAALSFGLSFSRTRATGQGQSAAFVKSPARLIAAASGSTQSSVRFAAKLLSVTAASAVALAVRRSGFYLFATVASAASLVVQRSGFRLYVVATTMAVALSRSEALIRAIVSPQTTTVTQARGKVLSLASAALPSIRLATNKLLAVLGFQIAASGRIDAKIIGTTSTNQARMSRPRGIVLQTFQAQVIVVATWYWLFVADWAYQQTTLLPPGGGLAEPPSFGPIDPADRTTFAFNWSSRGDPNDPLVSATVVSVPPGLTFFGPAFISGSLVEAIVVPSVPPQRPATYNLRCSATFASGRRSSFSIPVPVRTL